VTAEGRATEPRIVAAILTYRGLEPTRNCLKTLARSTSWPLPVVVVDNSSGTDEGVALAKEIGPPVASIVTSSNGGVPGGYNAALAWAADHGASHVLLLNNDTLLEDRQMLAALVGNLRPDVAAVGPWIRQADGKLQSAGGRLRRATGQASHVDEASSAPSRTQPYDVDWLDGACLLVSLDAVRRLGAFAPEFFLYWEEVDWCSRARDAGYRLVVEPRASVTHLGSLTVSRNDQAQLWMRNKILFARRHGGLAANLVTVLLFIGLTVPRQVVRSVRAGGGWRWAVTAGLAGLGWNVSDARRRRRWRVPASGPALADVERGV